MRSAFDIVCFNSKLVRLKGRRKIHPHYSDNSFNSKLVRLKVCLCWDRSRKVVSIPNWFD